MACWSLNLLTLHLPAGMFGQMCVGRDIARPVVFRRMVYVCLRGSVLGHARTPSSKPRFHIVTRTRTSRNKLHPSPYDVILCAVRKSAWCRCILRVRDLMRNCQCSICKMCFVVTCRRGMFHTTWHSCVRTTCLESGTCPTSPCTSRCGFARHRLTKKTACRQCLLHSGVRLWPCQASDGYCTGRACPSHARRRSQILWF